MEERKRRLLEPRDSLDRILYAIIAFTGPLCLASMYHVVPEDASIIFGIWCLISIFYTIELAINLYRKFRSKRAASSFGNGTTPGL